MPEGDGNSNENEWQAVNANQAESLAATGSDKTPWGPAHEDRAKHDRFFAQRERGDT